jgi:malate synthase
MNTFSIPYYHDYISPSLAAELFKQAKNVADVDGLVEVGEGGGLETKDALNFLCELYKTLEPSLQKVLNQRILDRKFIDERVKACYEFNKKLENDFLSPDYQTILGLEDGNGRIVIGPLNQDYCNAKPTAAAIAPIPEFLKGPHVTLFGPPGTAKMAINAMNAYHRKLKEEPTVVEKLLATQDSHPKWGADDEDSKTPLRADLVSSAVNLTKCFEGALSHKDEDTQKKYQLADKFLSVPIKRFPGLALPSTFLFFKGNPIPLHLYDFALHLFKNWNLPESLVFYVPKLENEEEAAYIHEMIFTAESMIHAKNPSYKLGSVRLMIVLENPRAILRTHEIMDALYPYFVGASLGWHDYLGSTARLFKEDANYRIPVKADPDIVIKYIKASHNLLADVVGSRGGIKVGGMYGILPLDNDLKSDSFQITIKGYIKDVVTQMKRNLTGFWVAHPDFVRLGLALVEGWKQHAEGRSEYLFELVRSLLNEKYHQEIFDFIKKEDLAGLDKSDSQYVRSLIVADIKESDSIANNHPDEIRYNVFQSLQYITDWLCGNGCVALPAHVHGTAVRVMDDLATAERSRWEVWHELYHGRFQLEDFLQIAFEEYQFIRKDLSNKDKIVQVKWSTETEKWYPIAFRLMIQLMTAKTPVEFATELLIPFTIENVRTAANPMAELQKIDSAKYVLDTYIERFIYHFEVCGSKDYAAEMAKGLMLDLEKSESLIKVFSKEQIIEAASFHGNIGESKKTLDHFAIKEQALVFNEQDEAKQQLKKLGETYFNKFGMKFLISAQGKSAAEMQQQLNIRMENSLAIEINNAQEALWQISKKRYAEKPLNNLPERLEAIKIKYKINDYSLAISQNFKSQSYGSKKWFQLASLSKPIATAFALDYFSKKNVSLDTPVNELLSKVQAQYRISHPEWGQKVLIKNLVNHSALNMHYVNGIDITASKPSIEELLLGSEKYRYSTVDAISEPSSQFNYSGGGFLVLEYLIEKLENKSIQDLTAAYLKEAGFFDLSFEQKDLTGVDYALGRFDDGSLVPNGRLMFPAFAAGAMGTATGVQNFLNSLTMAVENLEGVKGLSHDTACEMVYGTDKGCRNFMGCDMGLGIFVAECGDNKMVLHQGANEGFRALFVHVVSGPNKGDGFSLLCNADNRGVLFIAELAQEILRELNVSGIDFNKFKKDFNFSHLPQEQIVNLGYKQLIFSAFEPTLPEEILVKGSADPLADYNLLTHAKVIKASNQKFARATNLISRHIPLFDPELFCLQGKVMDSWESARHNPFEFDEIILEIPDAKPINFVQISTMYHDGNQAEFVRILGKHESSQTWVEVIPKVQMLGHSYLKLKLDKPAIDFTFFKIQMYPDGGLSRVGFYTDLPEMEKSKYLGLGEAKATRFAEVIPKTHKPLSLKYDLNPKKVAKNVQTLKQLQKPLNLAGLAFGAQLVSATNEHYGPAVQVISPYPAIHMFDGLESSRSRKKGHFEEVVIKLAEVSKISKIILDFTYFINNNPLEVQFLGLNTKNQWVEIVQKTNVKAFAGNKKEFQIQSDYEFSNLKLITLPDGGVNRLEVYA